MGWNGIGYRFSIGLRVSLTYIGNGVQMAKTYTRSHKTIFKTYTKRLSKKGQCEGRVIFGVFLGV